MPEKKYSNEEIARAATSIRKRILGLAIDRGGCYLAQACSSAEIVSTLYMNIMNLGPSLGCPDAQPFPGVPSAVNMDYPKGSLYNGVQDVRDPDKDRFFVSCCHYASVIYCALVQAGRMSDRAIDKFNVDGWNMEMIGAEHSPGFENTAGSLGQTVCIAAGTAHAYKMKGWNGKVYCMLSDGELEEGQAWECFQASAFYGLDNFVVYVDVNGQQVEGWTKDIMNTEPMVDRMHAFGWEAVVVDGHDIDALEKAARTPHPGKPLMVLCHTSPAHGIPLLDKMMPKHFVRIPAAEKDAFVQFYQQM
ncbi:MAG: thiamine pyrophosphate-dependent enzyme [Oscillibacter sp.]|jgi:transketolase|nr:thiamine pyrophosphate-dependent enzyme [Oscillibacter sp.]